MPRTKLFNEDEVLRKAMNLFWKQGYYATSIQDLVDHLGINRASLYDTFGGKEELFNKALACYRTSNTKAVIDFLDRQPSVKEGLKKLFEQAVSDQEAKGCFVVNTTTELAPADPKIRSVLAANKAEFEKLFHRYLQKGIDSGEIDKNKDIKAIAALLFTLYNGIKVVAKINADPQSLLSTVKVGLSVLD